MARESRSGRAPASTLQTLLAYAAAASILVFTPGPDTALVLRSAAGGPRPAAFAAAGILMGHLLWAATVSVGLGALLVASTAAFTALKMAGAAYLCWLGLKLVLQPRNSFGGELGATGELDSSQWFRRGFFSNLLNPKVCVFYLTLLPQFIPAGTEVVAFSLVLVLINLALCTIWFSVLIVATIPLARMFRRPTVVRSVDRVTGCVLMLFAARLAVSRAH
jgi:threonine/homoserine/homoserine lactone efflux protein